MAQEPPQPPEHAPLPLQGWPPPLELHPATPLAPRVPEGRSIAEWSLVQPPLAPTGDPGTRNAAAAQAMVRPQAAAGGGDRAPLSDRDLLLAILDELRSWVERGKLYYDTVTATVATNQQIVFAAKLFSLTIVNDGPNPIQIREPDEGGSPYITLNATEIFTLSYRKALIETIGYRVPTGTATVRLFGTY